MNWSPNALRLCSESIILRWLSVSRGGGLSSDISCCNEHGSVAPWRSTSSVVVLCIGVFCGSVAGIFTCMGDALDNATPQPKPGTLFAAAIGWCLDVFTVIFGIVVDSLDAMGLRTSSGVGVGIQEPMWMLAGSSCEEKILIVQHLSVFIFIKQSGCMCLFESLMALVFLHGDLSLRGCCSSCGTFRTIWNGGGFLVSLRWGQKVCNG